MGIDARVRYTKMVIKNSFIELLKTKSFHEITLKEVCELAEINRSTFYKYYHDIYDWREQMELEYTNGIKLVLEQLESKGLEEILIALCENIKNNIDIFKVLYSKNSESNVFEKTIAYALKEAEKIYQNKYFKNVNDLEKLNFNFCAFGCIGVFQMWIENGFKEEPKQIAKYLTQIIKKALGIKQL